MSEPGRRWLEVSVRAAQPDERAALLVDGLVALGGRAVEERDGWLVTHLESPSDVDAFRAAALSTLTAVSGIDAIELGTTWREHADWAETWKRGLGFRRITDRIGVRPSWVAAPDDAPAIVVIVDPGMAFGTAEHGTTRGCLRLLDGVVRPGARVLDVGAGSGVLAIAAALLGASEVTAIEGDPLAWEALEENIEINGVEARVRCRCGLVDSEDLAGYATVDGVVANIESATLIRLLPGFVRALGGGGWLILSGILATEWPSVREAAEVAGFSFRALDEDGEWRAGLFEIR
jgi:ribosomal protein L11 methyltransferase